MKIAVYAIAKNEAKHVAEFMKSCALADGVFVLDTGSTDDTVKLLLAAGAKVEQEEIELWRFDTARNHALAMIPKDYDVAVVLDLDERLVAGWRAALIWHFEHGATRVQANYTFNWKAPDVPDLVFYMDRAHARHGYTWGGMVHEFLKWQGPGPEMMHQSTCYAIHHFQDSSKPRTQYLPLLERAVAEDPEHDRNSHYLGREYFYYGRWQDCINELTRHLSLKSAQWEAERARSMTYMAQAYARLNNPREAHRWFLRAIAQWPEDREPWLLLGLHYLGQRNYPGGYYCASQALKLTERPLHYMTTSEAWGVQPHDLAACCAAWMKNHELALSHYKDALALEPDNARLKADYELTCQLAGKNIPQPTILPGATVILPKAEPRLSNPEKILMCLPSRGRPDKALEAVKSWRENHTECSDLCLILDEDDAQNYSWLHEASGEFRVIYTPDRVGPQLNKAALFYAPLYKAIGFIGDDHRIKTKGFDKIWLDKLNKSPGVAYGDDLHKHAALAGQCAMSSELILGLGFMHPKNLWHMWIDNAWMEIAKALGTLYYTPEVVIEHLHPHTGKAPTDQQYKWADMCYEHDGPLFQAWRNGPEFLSDIEKLKAYLAKQERVLT